MLISIIQMNSSKRVTNIYMTKMMVCIVAVVSLGFLLLKNICSSEEPLFFSLNLFCWELAEVSWRMSFHLFRFPIKTKLFTSQKRKMCNFVLWKRGQYGNRWTNWNFAYLENICNFYFSSNFHAFFTWL